VAEYMKLQIVFIHKYAKHSRITDELAAWAWINNGLAKKFAKLYREKFGMSKEK
jgi:hypothetical protein